MATRSRSRTGKKLTAIRAGAAGTAQLERRAKLLEELKLTLHKIKSRPLFNVLLEAGGPTYQTYPDFKAKIAATGAPVRGKIRFEYQNAAGEKTRRTVELKHYYPSGWPAYIVGHCHLRKEDRTFLIVNMLNVYDLTECIRLQNVPSWLLDNRDA